MSEQDRQLVDRAADAARLDAFDAACEAIALVPVGGLECQEYVYRWCLTHRGPAIRDGRSRPTLRDVIDARYFADAVSRPTQEGAP